MIRSLNTCSWRAVLAILLAVSEFTPIAADLQIYVVARTRQRTSFGGPAYHT